MAVSEKWCQIDSLLLTTTHHYSGKYHNGYRFVPFPITFNAIEGHLPVEEHFCDISHGFVVWSLSDSLASWFMYMYCVFVDVYLVLLK